MALANVQNTFKQSDLIEFLQDNPNIFQQHPELLELVTLVDSRGTASLLERQVAMLKERLRQFQSQQSEFVEVARENEQISNSFSDVICQLISYKNLSEFAAEFPKALRSTFSIDRVSFKTIKSAERSELDQKAYNDTLRRLTNNRAVCDNRWPSNIMDLFFSGSEGSNIASAALIPMRSNESSNVIGVLALGSIDAQRYTNDLGTAHLDRLGLMSGICLARLQPAQS